MIEQSTVDAYGDVLEQTTGWFTMIDESLAVPFETTVLGMPVTVERVDLECERADHRRLQAWSQPAGVADRRSSATDAAARGCGMDRSVPSVARKRMITGRR